MTFRKRLDSRARNEDGATLAFIALLLFAFLGVAALAVDLGMLMAARTDAQRVADAAALAGAGVLTGASDDETQARNTAKHFASLNDIRNVPADVRDEDVDIELDDWLVRVRVQRIAERNNPMSNLFARAIGIDTTDVSAVGAARWNPTGGANCLLPVIIPDRWWVDVAPGYGDSQNGPWPDVEEEVVFDPDGGDVYRPLYVFNEEGEIIEGPNEPHSSYNDYARGTQIFLTKNKGGGDWFPATYFAYRFPGDESTPGGKAWRDRISGCPDPDAVFYPGQLVDQEPGSMTGNTNKGFDELVAKAPNHEWRSSGSGVPEGGCVWDPDRSGGAGCIPAYDSPRTRVVPVFDPYEFPDNPSQPFRISHFAGMFVEARDGDVVTGRFVNYRGAEALPPGNEDLPGLGKILQLVE